MLTEQEKCGFRQLLSLMNNVDVVSLAKTTTKNMIGIPNKKEGVEAILLHAENASEVLGRRKIRHDVLFRYLGMHKIAIASNATKPELVKCLLDYWSSQLFIDRKNGTEIEEEPPEIEKPSKKCDGQVPENVMYLTINSTVNTTTNNHVIQIQELSNPSNMAPNVPPAQQTMDGITVVPNPQMLEVSEVPVDYRQLAEQFTKWYYKMLNTHHPYHRTAPEHFGPEHFFSNCTGQISIITDVEEIQETSGAHDTCQKLIQLVTSQHALFQPNINSDSMEIKLDQHGLIVVNVAGTIHNGESTVVGVFEQQFGLLQDPSTQGNYKIKFTRLICRHASSQQSLQQCAHAVGV